MPRGYELAGLWQGKGGSEKGSGTDSQLARRVLRTFGT
jgi:hypothetical protein